MTCSLGQDAFDAKKGGTVLLSRWTRTVLDTHPIFLTRQLVEAIIVAPKLIDSSPASNGGPKPKSEGKGSGRRGAWPGWA
jgi:hypothetical protein